MIGEMVVDHEMVDEIIFSNVWLVDMSLYIHLRWETPPLQVDHDDDDGRS